jgi:esterase/lipase superfamily enzyme
MAGAIDYVMSVRNVSKGQFVADVGITRFLAVPDGANPDPTQAITASAWYKAVTTAGEWKNAQGEDRGDILFVVHGYNNSESDVMQRHRLIRDGLAALAFKGVIVSFDWPSGDSALAYLPDRHRAKETALRLVDDGIRQLAARQTPDCPINIHILDHSTGAYVIREAFDDADDTQLAQSSWLVSQVLFAAGDVSSGSMSAGDAGAASIYRHCLRLTNYSNRNDSVLDISNVKRLGVAPRVGRIGLPPDSPAIAVNVDCTDYYAQLASDKAVQAADEPKGFSGAKSHSWYFGNTVFTRDVFDTVIGIENSQRTTRVGGADGKLRLARDRR